MSEIGETEIWRNAMGSGQFLMRAGEPPPMTGDTVTDDEDTVLVDEYGNILIFE